MRFLINSKQMLGTIINTATIVAGSVIGSFLKNGVKEEYRSALFNALGMVCLALGFNACITRMNDSEFPVLFIILYLFFSNNDVPKQPLRNRLN